MEFQIACTSIHLRFLRYAASIFTRRRLSLAALLLITACSTPENNPNKISMEQFADIYAQSVIWHHENDSLTAMQKIDSLLAANDISREELETAVASYQNDEASWQQFWKQVVENLEEAAKPEAAQDSVAAAQQ